MDHVTIKDIATFLRVEANLSDKVISGANTLEDSGDNDVSLVRSTFKTSLSATAKTRATLIIADHNADVSDNYKGVIIRSDNARYDFMRVLSHFFASPPTCIQNIHPSAVIGKNVKLGQNVTIYANVTIYDNVTIGDNCIIHSGCVIGADGFGFERDTDNKPFKFPHVGGVVIENNVEIMGLTHVARGTLGNTIIGEDTKIDGQCHIAHNVKIGKRCLITAGVTFAGSVIVGNDVYIAPACSIINKVKIGDNAFIGMAAFVKSDVKAGQTVVGSPARPIKNK